MKKIECGQNPIDIENKQKTKRPRHPPLHPTICLNPRYFVGSEELLTAGLVLGLHSQTRLAPWVLSECWHSTTYAKPTLDPEIQCPSSPLPKTSNQRPSTSIEKHRKNYLHDNLLNCGRIHDAPLLLALSVILHYFITFQKLAVLRLPVTVPSK